MQFITEYGLFFLKTATLVVATLLLVAGITAIAGRGQEKKPLKLSVKKVNQKLRETKRALIKHIGSKSELKKLEKEDKLAQKESKKLSEDSVKSKIFVLDFHGDVRASAVKQLREEITALLTVATPNDEVLLRLESGGGLVHSYGLAASQLQRIRQHNIPLTVCIDSVAASGGYLMAAVANRILAAPFAIIGSIGVLAQIPNFHRLLKKHHVDFEQLSAGEYKRTLSMFGEITAKGREKMQQQIEEMHDLFKGFLAEHRPQLDLSKVATGEYWPASHALKLKLVDALNTSDDYLMSLCEHHDIYELSQIRKKSQLERLIQAVQHTYKSLFSLF